MKEYERIIGQDKKRNIIAISAVPERYVPALVYFLDKLLGRVDPDENMINIFLSVLKPEQRTAFYLQLGKLKLKTIDSQILKDLCNDETSSVEYAAETISEGISKKDNKTKTDVNNLMLKIFISTFGGKVFEDGILKKTLELKEILDLTDIETKIIYAAHLSLCCLETKNIIHTCAYETHCALMGVLTGLPAAKIRQALNPKEKLVRMEYIDLDYIPSPFLDLRSDISFFLEHEEAEFYPEGDIFSIQTPSFNIKDFPHSAGELEIAKNILTGSGPSNILLHGEPGTGKTEMALALAKESAIDAKFLNIVNDNDAGTATRKIALILGMKAVERKGFILIVDEADTLLNSETMNQNNVEKAWIVNFMDNHKGKIIWITNSIDEIHPAVARRFSFNLRFEKFRSLQRRTIWNNLLEKNPVKDIIDSASIEKLSRDYDINAGGISTALKTLDQINPAQDKIIDVLRMLLKQHEELIQTQTSAGKLKDVAEEYNPAFINTNTDLGGLVSGVEKYYMNKPKLPFSILFHGAPGTGKTEFAKHLADSSDKQLIVKRSSDLVSKYVGETEKLIASTFLEAEEEEAILLLDEADSFFIDRSSAIRSWEKTQTNELLTRMENYKGVLICCTNFIESLDSAVLRRFTRKINFLPPKPEMLPAIFNSYFPAAELHDIQLHRLKTLEGITPGDFFTVKHSLSLTAEKPPETDEIIAALELEKSYQKKENVVGF